MKSFLFTQASTLAIICSCYPKFGLGNIFNLVSGMRCSSMGRAFGHGAMGRRIDPSWCGPIEIFLIPASAPRLV